VRAALLLLPCLALPCAAVLAGCDLTMSDQARHETAAGDRLWRGGPRDLPPPSGTVAQSTPALVAASTTPPPLTHELIARGRDRYEIYCTPCHGADGGGRGPVVQRGFPRPRDLAAPDQRALGADALFRAIGDGAGIMYGFADRVGPRDRWAIVAYVRALQLARGRTSAPSPARAEETRRFGGRT
jgi:mono/diheme cytochrome c family protein